MSTAPGRGRSSPGTSRSGRSRATRQRTGDPAAPARDHELRVKVARLAGEWSAGTKPGPASKSPKSGPKPQTKQNAARAASPFASWEDRYRHADYLYPGEVSRLVGEHDRLIQSILRVYFSWWVAKLGWAEAMQEAYVGAMKGISSWLVAPTHARGVVTTFIGRGIRYHFGADVPGYSGPIRYPRFQKGGGYTAPPRVLGEAGCRTARSGECLMALVENGRGADPVEAAEVVAAVTAAAERMDDRFPEIVARRLGLGGRPPEGLREVADAFGLSKERIRQIVADVVRAAAVMLGEKPGGSRARGQRFDPV